MSSARIGNSKRSSGKRPRASQQSALLNPSSRNRPSMAAEGASLLPSVTIVSRESTEFGEMFMASPYVRHTAADA